VGTKLTTAGMQCGHEFATYHGELSAGDIVFCARCDRYRAISDTDEWWVRCEVCTVHKRYGQDEFSADRAATAHNTKTGHEVGVSKETFPSRIR
jgi:hypothetical protein